MFIQVVTVNHIRFFILMVSSQCFSSVKLSRQHFMKFSFISFSAHFAGDSAG